MYKIMFVDDDLLILKHLQQIFDWESLGFIVLPSATNGTIALKKIEFDIPDILICDINMPNMNGLELIEILKISHPDIQCILLTVNDSFCCAQQALNLGVKHYLLKPIEPDQLKKLIVDITKTLNTSHEHEVLINKLYNKAKLNDRMIRDKFLNWLVSGRQSLNENQLIEKLNFYHLPINANEFQIVSIHINSFNFDNIEGEQLENLIQTVVTSLEDTLSPYSNCVVFTDSFYQFNVLVGFSNDLVNFGPDITFLCHLLKDDLLFNLNLPVTIFYSRRYKGLSNIYRCYYDTKFLSQYTSSIMSQGILSFDEYLNHAFDAQVDLDAIRTETFRQLRAGNLSKLFLHLHNTLEHPFSHGAFDTFNMLRIDFVMTGIMYLQENQLSLQDIFDKNYTPLSEIVEINTLDECTQFFEYYFGKIINYIQSNKISSGRLIAEKCIELIQQNISSPELSVKWISTQIYINENYLSRIFRKEMNLSLSKFITRERLKTAKNYLNRGYRNLQQISQMVGFSDPLYFSKCFKKEYGIAPSQYISKIN